MKLFTCKWSIRMTNGSTGMVRKDGAGWHDRVIQRGFGKWRFLGIGVFGSASLVATVAQALLLTDASFYPVQDYSPPAAASRNAGDIAIMEGGPANRPYRTIGRLVASARAFNLLTSDPTRADVDEALRAKAATMGADAVVGVRYRSEATGFASRGLMIGEGEAISWRR